MQEFVGNDIKPIVVSINGVGVLNSRYDKSNDLNNSLLKKLVMKASNIGFQKAYIIDNTTQSDKQLHQYFKMLKKDIDITFIQKTKLEHSIKALKANDNNVNNNALTFSTLKDLIKEPFVYININSSVCANDLHLALHYISNLKHNHDVFSAIGRKSKITNNYETKFLVYSDSQNNIQQIKKLKTEENDISDIKEFSTNTSLKINLNEIVLWCFTPRIFDYILKINSDNFDYNNEFSITAMINNLLERELINCKLILN